MACPRKIAEQADSWPFLFEDYTVKNWQCVLLSVAVHGLVFGLPVTPKTPPDLCTKEIHLMVLEPSPMKSPEDQTRKQVAAPKSIEPPDQIPAPVPLDKLPVRKSPALRKKTVPISKTAPAVPVPEEQPDSDRLSNKPSEVTEATQPASIRVADGVSDESTPVDNLSVNSETRPTGDPGHVVESVIGAPAGPQFIQKSSPRYPRLAQRLGLEGSVLLRLAIDASGKLTRVEVVNGAGNGFDEAAIQAVERSIFSPAVQNGRPVGCIALLKIRFQLSSK